MSKRQKVLRAITREELLKNNSIATRETGFESVNRYTIGMFKPDKAMQEVVIQGIREPVLLSNHDGSEATIKPTGASRLKKVMNKFRLKKDIQATDFLIDDDGLAVAKKHTGASRLKKVMKMLKLKKDIKATDFLSDDNGFEYDNKKSLSSKTDKYEEVVNIKKDLSALDYLSD